MKPSYSPQHRENHETVPWETRETAVTYTRTKQFVLFHTANLFSVHRYSQVTAVSNSQDTSANCYLPRNAAFTLGEGGAQHSAVLATPHLQTASSCVVFNICLLVTLCCGQVLCSQGTPGSPIWPHLTTFPS